jgi:serine/threonine protein kinase
MKDVIAGVMHMHSQSPPIAHRDLKVENILLENKKFKLCDFGSSSTDILDYQ